MARQQYNNRSITSYTNPQRIITPTTRNPVTSYVKNYGINRNKPAKPTVEERPSTVGSQIRDVLMDWLLNELDPWFYKAMRFESTNVFGRSYYCSIHSMGHRKAGFRETIGYIDFGPDSVTVSSRCSMVYSTECAETGKFLTREVQYCDPNMLELVEEAIRLIYNSEHDIRVS